MRNDNTDQPVTVDITPNTEGLKRWIALVRKTDPALADHVENAAWPKGDDNA